MAACTHADLLHMCMLAAMFNDKTYKESKGTSWPLPHKCQEGSLRECYIGDGLSAIEYCSHTLQALGM